MRKASTGRHAGLLAPLFAFPSTRSWGIGEIGDIQPMAAWLRRGRQDILQLLPINEMAPGQHSPYSAISAMAIDPLFISVYQVQDFVALGGIDALGPEFARTLAAARTSPAVDYQSVRALKEPALRLAFERFHAAEWLRATARAVSLRAYIHRQRWWLDDYALFRALHARHAERAWPTWDAPLRGREPRALDAARTECAREILFVQYLQWVADAQWRRARAAARPVALFGDFPFMVATDSADVWAWQDLFRLDASVGAPPDAFSPTGQDWRMPVYDWEAMRARDDAWLRQRARRSADLYAGYRIDHLVGFYRTYARPHDGGPPYFTPAAEPEQLALGERVMAVFTRTRARIVVEDLGTVPDFVRASIARLGIPGYRVLRWEREWDQNGQPFRDPAQYPALSVATSGTHDTDPMAVWWTEASADERAKLRQVATLRSLAGDDFDWSRATYTPDVRDALLQTLFEAGSNFLILPIQDVFGWSDRINVPATVSEENWTFRLPWPSDELDAQPEARERADALRRWSGRYGRGRH